MSLIKCPECGKEISDKAESCPHCGCPSNEWKNNKANDENRNSALVQLSNNELDSLYNETNGKRIVLVKTLSEKYDLELSESKKIVDKYWSEKFPEKKLHYTRQTNLPYSQTETNKNPKHEFHGIYRYDLFGEKIEVHCPRCGSENCSYYQEQKIIPGKTKTRYSVNLNPLKPFTIFNKKEKVVRADKVITESKIVCNNCGWIF